MDQPQSVPPVQNQKPIVQHASRSLWWLAVIVVVALGLSLWSWVNKDSANTNTANANTAGQNSNVSQNTNAAATYSYAGQDGKTALELLKAVYPNTRTKVSGSLGEQVMGINGREAGSNEYWQFLVNGKAADVGPSAYVTKSTDMIEWKLTSF